MKRLLFFYSHFSPAYKAGGPIQSLRNLTLLLVDTFFVDIICSARDLREQKTLDGIVPDTWNPMGDRVRIFYVDKSRIPKLRREIDKTRPDVIYVNGMFLPFYSWLPLIFAKIYRIPVIVTPRGMLQRGAMTGNSNQKRLSIVFLKGLGLFKNVTWQATDEQERLDIQSYFGLQTKIYVVGNVPKPPREMNRPVRKGVGELRLVFLSLIARKKNLDLILRVLKDIKQPVSLDIYGPVKDVSYWEECQYLISRQTHSVNYMGPANPEDVQEMIGKYHAFILLTKGENFGHAIYEALSTGTPAIISQYTPWGELQSRGAGITVDINDIVSCRAGLEKFWSLGEPEFNMLSKGAFELAKHYYTSGNFKEHYTEMFNDVCR